MQTFKNNWPKFIVGFAVCLLIRLVPFRPPNIEPILATVMPFGKAFGALSGVLFAFFSIVLYDIFTGTLGVWSLMTAGAYGALGLWSAFYFRRKASTPLNYAKFAILGTLFFDAVTGLSVGPLFFGQPFMAALLGQIPFTLWHLLGNVSFALVLSPAIYRFVTMNEKLQTGVLFKVFKFR